MNSAGHQEQSRRKPRLHMNGLGAKALALLGTFAFVAAFAFAQSGNPTLAEFTLTATGDSMLMTPASVRQNDPGFMGVVKAVRQGDAAFTNIEEMYAGPKSYPAATSGNTYMAADPSMLKELQWIGFNLFGAVNNHSYDYGLQGVLDTLANLKANGAVFAGIGETLGEAREPHYLATAHGRVAILATTSTFLEAAPAADPRPDSRGRPGINPLHYSTVYNVDAASFAALKKVSDDLQLAGPGRGNQQSVTFPEATDPFGKNARIVFQQSDKPGVATTADPSDVAEISRSIKDARQMANYVVMSIHAHEGLPGPDGNSKPAQFLEQFAHAAVDAGADVFVGQGPQQLRGIEIYKGSVIFYSLGGFFYQDNIVRVEPSDFYKRYGLGPDARPSEGYDARGGALAGTSGSLDEPHNESVVAKVLFKDRKPVEVVLTPITISVDRRPDYGIPRLADPQMANKILQYLQKLSQPYGTNIVIKDGVGTIAVEQSHR